MPALNAEVCTCNSGSMLGQSVFKQFKLLFKLLFSSIKDNDL